MDDPLKHEERKFWRQVFCIVMRISMKTSVAAANADAAVLEFKKRTPLDPEDNPERRWGRIRRRRGRKPFAEVMGVPSLLSDSSAIRADQKETETIA